VPRPFRLEYPDACWHVHNRGVERRDIFLDDDDRRFFLTLLGEVAIEYEWRTCNAPFISSAPILLSYSELWVVYRQFVNRAKLCIIGADGPTKQSLRPWGRHAPS
jgi:hypothetical protein